jgi:hypothetical protein
MCEMYHHHHHLSHYVRLAFVPFSIWGLYVTEELAAYVFGVNDLGLGAGSKFLPNVTTPSFNQHRPWEPETLTHMCRDWTQLVSTNNAVCTAESVLVAGLCSEMVVHLVGGSSLRIRCGKLR